MTWWYFIWVIFIFINNYLILYYLMMIYFRHLSKLSFIDHMIQNMCPILASPKYVIIILQLKTFFGGTEYKSTELIFTKEVCRIFRFAESIWIVLEYCHPKETNNWFIKLCEDKYQKINLLQNLSIVSQLHMLALNSVSNISQNN